MALPTAEQLIGMKERQARELVESNGGTFVIYRSFKGPNEPEPTETLMDDSDWRTDRYNVAIDRGNVVVDCMIR